MALLDAFKSIFSGGGKLNVTARFAIQREAISGTMSSFYKARDIKTGKIVGLKVLDPKKTEAFESRFKSLKKPCEGAIAMQLRHPRIVETFEHGLTTEGAQYIVMEFLEGPDFNSLVIGRDGRLAGHRAKFIRQIAEALVAVHAAGFIHRDMCPRNVMLTDSENLKLIDFGLTVPATSGFMQPGNRTGTPNYMAPEVVRRRPTDKRLDIFAFGATAYELCALALPWPSGDTGMAAMSHDKPPIDVRKHYPKLHPKLAAAIHACIEPELSKRCPTMDAFLEMIDGVKGDE